MPNTKMNNRSFYFFLNFKLFVSVITVYGSKTASVFFNITLLYGKVNIVRTCGRLTKKKLNSFQKHRQKQNKN